MGFLPLRQARLNALNSISRHVQPTGNLGRVVKLEAFTMRRASAAGSTSRKGTPQRWVFRLSSTTRITGHQVGHVNQPPHLVGEVHGMVRRSVMVQVAPARPGDHRSGRCCGCRRVDTRKSCRRGRPGWGGNPGVRTPASSWVEVSSTPPADRGRTGFGIQVQHVLHGRHEFAALLSGCTIAASARA